MLRRTVNLSNSILLRTFKYGWSTRVLPNLFEIRVESLFIKVVSNALIAQRKIFLEDRSFVAKLTRTSETQGPVIENISRRCGGFLKQLSLRGCQSIGNNSMRTLAQSCTNIEELNLSQCKKISDTTCAALSSHCSKLQRLNLDSCPEITDISLKDLSNGCPLLTHINLSWCELLTDKGVEALARGCPELRSFLCKGCRQLTDRAVKCLARYCHNLEAINLHECRVLANPINVTSMF